MSALTTAIAFTATNLEVLLKAEGEKELARTATDTKEEKCDRDWIVAKSVQKIIGDETREVVIYGFRHCHYDIINSRLSTHAKTLDLEVHDYSIALIRTEFKSFRAASEPLLTLCKDALVQIVLENVRRSKTGKPPIIVLFCVDIDDNAFPIIGNCLLPSSRKLITATELKVAYKLCNTTLAASEEVEIVSKINEVAKHTFRFGKVKLDSDHYITAVEPTSAPWEDDGTFTKNWIALKTQPKKPSVWKAWLVIQAKKLLTT